MVTSTGQLIVQLGGEVIQTISLNLPVLIIGRTPDSDLSLPHQLISRRHAEVRMGQQGPVLTDLGSSNGTFIDGQRLLPNQPRVLTDGFTFAIGPYQLTYRETQAALPEDDHPTRPLPPVPTQPEPALPLSAKRSGALQPIKPEPRALTDDLESSYLRDLPDIFQEGDFLRRFLLMFEEVWEPLEQRQDHIEMYFDPHTCPASFLPWLASWLDLSFNAHWPETRRRRLLAQAMELYSWRGTRYGLERMIEVCTGLTPVITEKPSQPFVFYISIKLPAEASLVGETVDRVLIDDLIQAHKPAYAGYILEVNP